MRSLLPARPTSHANVIAQGLRSPVQNIVLTRTGSTSGSGSPEPRSNYSMPYEHAYYCAPRNKSRLKQSLSSRCTAGFRAAYDRCGSNPDLSASARMSPSAWCGHDASLALGSNVPLPELMHCNKWPSYSITSSTIARTPGGIFRSSALTVARLITSSNLIDCNTGRSAGFSPLRIRPTYTPVWRYPSAKSVP